MHLILLGLRGSGKSTIGPLVASRLGRPFIDLDDLTPRVLGHPSVAAAWAHAGEPAFRRAEVRALTDVLSGPDAVVALGGGTPTAPGASDLLRQHRAKCGSTLVYLRLTPRTLRGRLELADNTHRPPLTPGSTNPLDEIDRVHAARDPLYVSLADHVIDGGDGPEAVSEAIMRALIGRES